MGSLCSNLISSDSTLHHRGWLGFVRTGVGTQSLGGKSICYVILKSQRVKVKNRKSGMVFSFYFFKDLFLLVLGRVYMQVPSTSKRGPYDPLELDYWVLWNWLV